MLKALGKKASRIFFGWIIKKSHFKINSIEQDENYTGANYTNEF